MSLLTDELNLKCYVLYETKELLTEIYITIINILIFIVSIAIAIFIIIIIITINVINIISLPYLLNRHGRYVKLNSYLLQFLCHMTSDVKYLHMLFLFTFSLFKIFNIYELK